MALILNGIDQRAQLSAAFSMFNNAAAYTIAIRVKPDATVTTEQFIAGGYHNGGLDRHSGFIYRGGSTPKTYAKVKSSSVLYRPATPAAAQQATGGWDLIIFDRNGVVGGASPSNFIVNSQTANTETSEENGASDLVLFGLGARRQSTGVYTGFLKGKIYDFAAWSIALDSTAKAQLVAGARLDAVQSGSLVDHMEFTGTGSPASITTRAGRTLTLVGSPALDDDTPYRFVDGFNGGSNIVRGQQSVSYATTGFASITAINSNQAGISVTGITDSSGDGTSNVSDYVEGGLYPLLPTSVQFQFTDGANTASITKTVSLKPGEVSTITAGSVTDDITFIPYWLSSFGRSTANGGQYVVTPGPQNAQVDATGKVVADAATTFQMWYRDPGNNRMYEYLVTVNGGGEVIDVSKKRHLLGTRVKDNFLKGNYLKGDCL